MYVDVVAAVCVSLSSTVGPKVKLSLSLLLLLLLLFFEHSVIWVCDH